MKSVRTKLPYKDKESFRAFLDAIGLHEVLVGDYTDISDTWYTTRNICYAYSEKSDETVAILTHISLKYGNMQEAFKNFTSALMNSSMHDPYFNWIP